MQSLKNEVIAAMKAELERASKKFGDRHNSPHEAYGVIAEEIFEAKTEANTVGYNFDWLIETITKNDVHETANILALLQEHALLAACEYIQVAAMCQKARRGYKDGSNVDVCQAQKLMEKI